ncbi:MAG: hypothetical protein GWP21_08155 [Euryarchaeota archaeon]|nr:hypothetical protein [Euryarchaeota archaeon]
MKNRAMRYFLTMTIFVLSIPVVSAHGDAESSSILTNIQIFLISVSISAVVFLVLRTKFPKKLSVFTPSIFSLALLSGLVHILLGITDQILLLGGVGVLAIIASPMLIKFNDARERIARFSLAGLSLLMFIAYFVSNHDIHYVLEDYLGIVTKISEIGVIIGLVKLRKIAGTEEE